MEKDQKVGIRKPVKGILFFGQILLLMVYAGITESRAQESDWEVDDFKKKYGDITEGSLDFYSIYAPRGEIRFLPDKQLIYEESIDVTATLLLTGYQLPDLRTLPAHDLRVVANDHAGTRQLQFSNSIWNAGDGPMEFRGTVNEQEQTVEVFQVLYENSEPGEEIPMGNFYYSESHNHWHWAGFSKYEIWTVGDNGSLEEIIAESGKVGYCIRDDSRVDTFNVDFHNPNSADRPGYRSCGTRVQGLSVGWVDTYVFNTPGQSLDITGIPEGLYALRSVVDPEGEIIELNKENNEMITYFQLETFRARIVEVP
jgi:hypothetical protein